MSRSAKAYLDDYEDDNYDDDNYNDGYAGQADNYGDADLLDSTYDEVDELTGGNFREDDIVAALRASEYDSAAATQYLLDGRHKKTPAQSGAGSAAKQSTPAKPAKGGAATQPAAAGSSSKGGAAGKAATTATPGKTPASGAGASGTPAPAATPASAPAPAATVTPHSSAAQYAHLHAHPQALPPVPEAVTSALAAAKPRISVVCIGHVDAGKSTLMGHLLYDLGCVPPKMLQKFIRDSKAAGKASFAFAWVLDEEEGERARGVTVDVATNHFETPAAVFTLLDAPGHRDFVPHTITGVAQADAAVLVVDATPGEFEVAISGGGQAKEHATLARNFGVTQLLVAVNKMDASTVRWSQKRFEEIRTSLLPVLQNIGFKKENIVFVPVSGLTGLNLVKKPMDEAARLAGRGSMSPSKPGAATRSVSASSGGKPKAANAAAGARRTVDEGMDDLLPQAEREAAEAADMLDGMGIGPSSSAGAASRDEELVDLSADLVSLGDVRALTAWYTGPTLAGAMDALRPPPRPVDKAMRFCVSDVYRSGSQVMAAGRLESGYLLPHTRILVVPGHEVASVKHLAVNGSTAPVILAGDNADIGLGGIEEAVLSPGCVLSWPTHPARAVTRFKAQIALFGSTTASGASSDGAMQATTMPLVPGQQFMLHSHTAAEPCNVTRLLRTLDRDGHTKERKPRCVTAGQVAVVRIRLARPVCLDTFAEHKRLGRFLLRYSGKSVAAGMVLKITA